jgi:exodeoxyribonuclease VII small subunit
MAICNKQLNEAERKVETLIKNRNGELTLGTDERPITQEYKMASGRMGGHE